MEPPGRIDIIHHLFNFISIRIRSVAKEIPIFKRLLGNFLIFTTFPPEDSLGLFVCYEGHIQDVKTVEIVFVAICSRSYHKMPVLKTERFVGAFNTEIIFHRHGMRHEINKVCNVPLFNLNPLHVLSRRTHQGTSQEGSQTD